jgi:hypothetical protein
LVRELLELPEKAGNCEIPRGVSHVHVASAQMARRFDLYGNMDGCTLGRACAPVRSVDDPSERAVMSSTT